MINKLFRYLVIYIILLLLQVLMFNNIQFSGYVNPYVYVLFILLLPVETAGWLLLTVSFFAGLLVDVFTGTPGMHAGASAAAAFVRPYILGAISPRDGYEPEAEPSMASYGFRWFIIYASVVVLIHHLFLFYLEVFRFDDFFRTFLRVIFSSLFTVVFIVLAEYFRKGR